MKRVSVTIPDELAGEVRRRLPALNVSGLLQNALRAALGCSHGQLTCATCAASLDPGDVAREALDALYRDLVDGLEDLLWSAGTLEGFGVRLKNVAQRHNVRLAFVRPLPRHTRAEREAAKHRHPSAQEVTGAKHDAA